MTYQNIRKITDGSIELRKFFHKPQNGLGGAQRSISSDMTKLSAAFNKQARKIIHLKFDPDSSHDSFLKLVYTLTAKEYVFLSVLYKKASELICKRLSGETLSYEDRRILRKAFEVLKTIRKSSFKNFVKNIASDDYSDAASASYFFGYVEAARLENDWFNGVVRRNKLYTNTSNGLMKKMLDHANLVVDRVKI